MRFKLTMEVESDDPIKCEEFRRDITGLLTEASEEDVFVRGSLEIDGEPTMIVVGPKGRD